MTSFTENPPHLATLSKNGLVFSIKGGSPLPPSPKESSSSSSSTSLRIVSLNMASGNVGPQWQFPKGGGGANHHEIRRQLIETMFLESRADVICVQESVIKSKEWSYRSENSNTNFSSSSRKLGSSFSSSTTATGSKALVSSTAPKKTQKLVNENDERSRKESVAITSTEETKKEDLEEAPVYVRSQEKVLTHCGETFLYFNKKSCELIREGKIDGGNLLPSFPVIAIRKTSCNTKNSSSSSSNDVVFLICSIHLHPFPFKGSVRQNQFEKLLSQLDRLEKLWKLDAGLNCCHKIIAGDTNMTNEQFPKHADCQRVIDCWYEFVCGSQNPRAEFFKEKEPFINPQHQVLKFFKDSYTFGGENDYNQSGMKALVKYCYLREPFYMRYDRCYIVKQQQQHQDDDDDDDDKTKRTKNPIVKVKHMQRFLDNRFVIESGNGYIDYDNDNTMNEKSSGGSAAALMLGGKTVTDLPGRLLSDHFGLLIDLEVV